MNDLGFDQWFARSAKRAYTKDPWRAFDAAVGADIDSEEIRALVSLFLLREPVAEERIVEVLGAQLTAWLVSGDVLKGVGRDNVVSRYCLLVASGLFYFVDWPLRLSSGRLTSRETYLSCGTYDCLREIDRMCHGGKSLDLGTGAGLLALSLAKKGCVVSAIDVDDHALSLARLNLRINDLQADVIHCSWRDFVGSSFQLVVANPPWRLIPPEISYPYPVARRGAGELGLDCVLETLRVVEGSLAKDGAAIIRFDMPLNGNRNHMIAEEIEAILGPDKRFQFQVHSTISAEEQARTSSETCAFLNPSHPDLNQRFVDFYAENGIAYLHRGVAIVTAH
jgi:hypothetical protein